MMNFFSRILAFQTPLWLALLLISSCTPSASDLPSAQHPRILQNAQELQELQKYLQAAPSYWTGTARKILNEPAVANPKFSKRAQIYQIHLQALMVQYVMGDAQALPQIRDSLFAWRELKNGLSTEHEGGWGTYVPPGSAFFTSIIALDYVWNDLSAKDRQDLYALFQEIVVWFRTHEDPHALNRLGIDFTWAIFRNDSIAMDTTAWNYRNFMDYEASAGGVHGGGTSYAWQRLAGDRLSKAMGIPLLLKFRPDSLRDENIPDLYRWIFCGATTSFTRLAPFGDSGPNSNAKASPIRWFAISVAPEIAGCATNARVASNSRDLFFDMIYTRNKDIPVQPYPRSMVFGGGYAKLAAAPQESNDQMMVALWNPLRPEWHAHPEHNGIYLGGYEAHLLMGSGYAGAKKGAMGMSWNDIHSTPRFGNVLLPLADTTKDGKSRPHTIGILTDSLQYSSSEVELESIAARHRRSIVRIPGNSFGPAFVVVIDELRADSTQSAKSSNPSVLFWHPYSSQTPIQSGEWISWEIEKKPGMRLGIRSIPKPQSQDFFPSAVTSDNQKYNFARTSLRVRQDLTLTKPVLTLFVPSPDVRQDPASTWKCNSDFPLKCQTPSGELQVTLGKAPARWNLQWTAKSSPTPLKLSSFEDQSTLEIGKTIWTSIPIPAKPVNNGASMHWYANSFSDLDFARCDSIPASASKVFRCETK